MAYAVQRVLMSWDSNPELVLYTSLCGFPSAFNYLLFSEWVCLGTGGNRGVGIGFPSGAIGITVSQSVLTLEIGYGNLIFNGTFSAPIGNLSSHVLVSADPTTQRVQIYINDAPVTLSTGGWVGSGPFDLTFAIPAWELNASGSVPPGAGVGDLWASNMSSFIDLNVTANRRKFINADLTPVDLGNTGSGPFGTQPPLFLTVRPGDSNPSHFANNNGSGGAWTILGAPVLAFEPNIGCVPPPPPTPPPVPPPKLAMDNVIASANTTQLSVNLISLRWSDDRGHSWSSPVTQDIGEAGEYRTSLQWQRLAFARDRVFEISWSVPMRTALQGCWVDVTPAQS